ncbi:MAG: class I SAM-dependent methyltransferase [Parvularculaceae bacterium]
MSAAKFIKPADWPTPSLENLKRVGAQNEQLFFEIGSRLANAVDEELRIATGKSPADLEVLDFGCGCGRVAIPFIAKNGRLSGTDIDASAIEFLKASYPGMDFRTNKYAPSLPYADGQFDAVYSISVWTHMNEETGKAWLAEIARILRPGGVFLNSIMSHTSLVYRQLNTDEHWGDVTTRALRDKGVLFREYDGYKKNPAAFPGVEASYGMTFYDDEYVRKNWRGDFAKLEILPGRMSGQDLVILRKVS